jgi:hypothetical protein
VGRSQVSEPASRFRPSIRTSCRRARKRHALEAWWRTERRLSDALDDFEAVIGGRITG